MKEQSEPDTTGVITESWSGTVGAPSNEPAKTVRSHIGRGQDSAFPRFEDITLTHPSSLQYIRAHEWHTDAKTSEIERFGEAFFTEIIGYPKDGTYAVVGWYQSTLFHINFSNGHLGLRVAAHTDEECNAAIEEALKIFPVRTPSAERQQVSFRFWNTSSSGPDSNYRVLDVPRWDEIAQNYSKSTRDLLSGMMEMNLKDRSANDSKLHLWSGKPGGGKTYGIRALAWELRKEAMFEYIVDPESLFGDSSYFISVLLDDDTTDKWRILIMEDTGELLAANAKERTGQGMSRLLNVMDGLIGQGLKVMILITTNEDLGSLHPAVTRPGRCASNINFQPLTLQESNDWLARYECGRTVNKSQTLAELFAIRHAEELKTNWENRPTAGFTAELSTK